MHGPGLPSNAPDFPSDGFDRAAEQAAALLAGTAAADLDTAGWTPHQWVHFLRTPCRTTPNTRVLADLDRTYGLSGHGNVEVASAWLELAIGSGFVWSGDGVDEAVAGFLTRHGRAMFLRRVYSRLAATPRGLERAREIFALAADGYHSVSRGIVARILGGP